MNIIGEWVKTPAGSIVIKYVTSTMATGLISRISWDTIKDSETSFEGAALAIAINSFALTVLHFYFKHWIERKKVKQINEKNLTKTAEENKRVYINWAKQLQDVSLELHRAKKNDIAQKEKDERTIEALEQEQNKAKQELDHAESELIELKNKKAEGDQAIKQNEESLREINGKISDIDLKGLEEQRKSAEEVLPAIDHEISNKKAAINQCDKDIKSCTETLKDIYGSIDRQKQIIEEKAKDDYISQQRKTLEDKIEKITTNHKKQIEVINKTKEVMNKKQKNKEDALISYKDAFINYKKTCQAYEQETIGIEHITCLSDEEILIKEAEFEKNKNRAKEINDLLQKTKNDIEENEKKLNYLTSQEIKKEEEIKNYETKNLGQAFDLPYDFEDRTRWLAEEKSKIENRLKCFENISHVFNQEQHKQQLEATVKKCSLKIKAIENFGTNLQPKTSLPDETTLINSLDSNENKVFQEHLQKVITTRSDFEVKEKNLEIAKKILKNATDCYQGKEIKLGLDELILKKKNNEENINNIKNNIQTIQENINNQHGHLKNEQKILRGEELAIQKLETIQAASATKFVESIDSNDIGKELKKNIYEKNKEIELFNKVLIIFDNNWYPLALETQQLQKDIRSCEDTQAALESDLSNLESEGKKLSQLVNQNPQFTKEKIKNCLELDSAHTITDELVKNFNELNAHLKTDGLELIGIQASRNSPVHHSLQNTKFHNMISLHTSIIAHNKKPSKNLQKLDDNEDKRLLANCLKTSIRWITWGPDPIRDEFISIKNDTNKNINPWKEIPNKERPKEYVCIVNVGKYFFYAESQSSHLIQQIELQEHRLKELQSEKKILEEAVQKDHILLKDQEKGELLQSLHGIRQESSQLIESLHTVIKQMQEKNDNLKKLHELVGSTEYQDKLNLLHDISLNERAIEDSKSKQPFRFSKLISSKSEAYGKYQNSIEDAKKNKKQTQEKLTQLQSINENLRLWSKNDTDNDSFFKAHIEDLLTNKEETSDESMIRWENFQRYVQNEFSKESKELELFKIIKELVEILNFKTQLLEYKKTYYNRAVAKKQQTLDQISEKLKIPNTIFQWTQDYKQNLPKWTVDALKDFNESINNPNRLDDWEKFGQTIKTTLEELKEEEKIASSILNKRNKTFKEQEKIKTDRQAIKAELEEQQQAIDEIIAKNKSTKLKVEILEEELHKLSEDVTSKLNEIAKLNEENLEIQENIKSLQLKQSLDLANDNFSKSEKEYEEALNRLNESLIQIKKDWQQQIDDNNQNIDKIKKNSVNIINHIDQEELKKHKKLHCFIEIVGKCLNNEFADPYFWNSVQKWIQWKINQYATRLSKNIEKTKHVEYLSGLYADKKIIKDKIINIDNHILPELKKEKTNINRELKELKEIETKICLLKSISELKKIEEEDLKENIELKWIKYQESEIKYQLSELTQIGINEKIKKIEDENETKILQVQKNIDDTNENRKKLFKDLDEKMDQQTKWQTELDQIRNKEEQAKQKLEYLKKEKESIEAQKKTKESSCKELEKQISEFTTSCDTCERKKKKADDQSIMHIARSTEEQNKRQKGIHNLNDNFKKTEDNCEKARADWDESVLELASFKIRCIKKMFLEKARDVCIQKERLYAEKSKKGSNKEVVKNQKKAVLNATLDMMNSKMELANNMKDFSEKTELDVRKNKNSSDQKLNALEVSREIKERKYKLINLNATLYPSCNKWSNNIIHEEKFDKQKQLIEKLFNLRAKKGPFELWRKRDEKTGQWKSLGEIEFGKEYNYHTGLCEIKKQLSILNIEIISLKNQSRFSRENESSNEEININQKEKEIKSTLNEEKIKIEYGSEKMKQLDQTRLKLIVQSLENRLRLLDNKNDKDTKNNIKLTLSSLEKSFINNKLQSFNLSSIIENTSFFNKGINLVSEKIAFIASSALLYVVSYSGAKNHFYQIFNRYFKASISWQTERVLWIISSFISSLVLSGTNGLRR